MQDEKIAELEKRIVELEKQVFGTPFKNFCEKEVLWYIAVHCQPTIYTKLELLLKHFGLQFETIPEKIIIKEKQSANDQQQESK